MMLEWSSHSFRTRLSWTIWILVFISIGFQRQLTSGNYLWKEKIKKFNLKFCKVGRSCVVLILLRKQRALSNKFHIHSISHLWESASNRKEINRETIISLLDPITKTKFCDIIYVFTNRKKADKYFRIIFIILDALFFSICFILMILVLSLFFKKEFHLF